MVRDRSETHEQLSELSNANEVEGSRTASKIPRPLSYGRVGWAFGPPRAAENSVPSFALLSPEKHDGNAELFSIFIAEGKRRGGCVFFATAVTRG
jgi:hypothetical protein